LRAPIVRVAGINTVIPFNLALEKATVPQVADIVAGVRAVLGDPALAAGQPEAIAG
jgi:pyruvate/2-oxoglutarate/acetoin dehydrogenase E1 component